MDNINKIYNLSKGQSVVLSNGTNGRTVAERNGKGDKVTVYRENDNGFEVIRIIRCF